jgi:hypothetical protein
LTVLRRRGFVPARASSFLHGHLVDFIVRSLRDH